MKESAPIVVVLISQTIANFQRTHLKATFQFAIIEKEQPFDFLRTAILRPKHEVTFEQQPHHCLSCRTVPTGRSSTADLIRISLKGRGSCPGPRT